MPTPADITRIAEEHAELSQNVASYDHAPAELRDTTDLLESLEKDLGVRESRMNKLIAKRKAEHKDLDKLQRSGTKRFFIRMKHGGKEALERKLEKEEREYIEAAQNEHNESQAISELRAAAENARLKKADLESQVVLRREMLQKINDLYESAFDGPSPDFPEEDAAEDELREAEVHFEHIQARLSHEKNIFNILDQAASRANEAQSALQSANLAATYDTFSIGRGIWAQMAEADDLLRAQTLAAQAHRLLERARGSQPLVKPVPCGKIVSPEWLNVVFDNMYTDFMFQQKIKQSIDSMRNYQEGIYAECAASEERIKNHTQDATDAREFLKSRRRQLVATRREILARVREDGGVRVFTHSDADAVRDGSGSEPQLPTYAQQPEEGARVLATGEPQDGDAASMPVPAHEDRSMPPRYNSRPDSPPSVPQAETHSAHPQFLPPVGPPPGHAGEGVRAAPSRSDAPTSSPPPSQVSSSFVSSSALRMPEISPHEHLFTSSPVPTPTTSFPHPEPTDTRRDSSNTDRTGSLNVSHETPKKPTLNNGDRGEPPRASFASNNPYRAAS